MTYPDVTPVLGLNLTLFSVETSTTDKQQSKTTWRGATVFNPWKQEEEGHFYPSVLSPCDCWASNRSVTQPVERGAVLFSV